MAEQAADFESIYTEHRPAIHRYLTRLAGATAADDLTQETFIRVGQGLGVFNNRAALSTWIYRIATNVATDRLRSRAFKEESATVPGADSSHSPPCRGAAASPEDQLIRKEMNECIQSYVGFLPENYRVVLVLSELEGFRSGEIAAILGISPGTVKIRLHRAKEKLRQELAANCIFYRTDCNQLACEPKGPVKRIAKPLSVTKKSPKK